MPKLVVKKKAEVIREIDLKNTVSSLSIGAEEGNDLVIDDKRISMTHAYIERQGNRYYVRDNKSAFGTYLNGQKIEGQSELSSSDELRLGEHTVVFDNPLENLDVTFGEAKTGNDRIDPASETTDAPPPGAPSTTHEETLDALEAELRKDPFSMRTGGDLPKDGMAPYYLLAIHGPYAGKRYQLKYGETRIGRDNKLNDIVIRHNKGGEVDPSISRRHATIGYRDNAFWVADKRSKTRTSVNQDVLPADRDSRLKPGDEIEIVSDQDSTIFRFVDAGNWDFSPPKKSGVWWVRYQNRFMTAMSGAAILAGLYFLVAGFMERSMITQRPDALALELTTWSPSGMSSKEINFASTYNVEIPGRSSPASADFNGDGYVDIATTDLVSSPQLVDGKGQRSGWVMEAVTVDARFPLVAADLNQNGLDDLILVTDEGKVMAVDGQFGAEIWTSPFFRARLTGPPVAADFDADGWVDVAVADEDGNVHIGYNRAVKVEWGQVETGVPLGAPITGADLDQDGDVEILCGSERGLVLIIDGATREIAGAIDINDELNQARGTFYEDNQIRYPVGVADLTGDGKLDIVVSSVQGNVIAIGGATRKRLWHAALNSGLTFSNNYPFPFALGDFTGDGRADVVVVTDQGVVKAFSGKGDGQEPRVIWEQSTESSGGAAQGLSIADLNKDGVADVLFVGRSGMMHILDGVAGQPMWRSAEPIADMTSMPLVADLSSDGLLDILLISDNNRVYQFITNSRVPNASVVWGQRFGRGTNVLSSQFAMPGTARANASMGLGFLALAGGGVGTVMMRRKKRGVGASA